MYFVIFVTFSPFLTHSTMCYQVKHKYLRLWLILMSHNAETLHKAKSRELVGEKNILPEGGATEKAKGFILLEAIMHTEISMVISL